MKREGAASRVRPPGSRARRAAPRGRGTTRLAPGRCGGRRPGDLPPRVAFDSTGSAARRQPRTWLFRILLNACNDRRRRNLLRRRERPAERALPVDPARRTARRELVDRVFDAVDELPRRQRECLLLRVRAGLAYAEIASLLEIGVGSVKSHLVQGRRALVHRFGRGARRMSRGEHPSEVEARRLEAARRSADLAVSAARERRGRACWRFRIVLADRRCDRGGSRRRPSSSWPARSRCTRRASRLGAPRARGARRTRGAQPRAIGVVVALLHPSETGRAFLEERGRPHPRHAPPPRPRPRRRRGRAGDRATRRAGATRLLARPRRRRAPTRPRAARCARWARSAIRRRLAPSRPTCRPRSFARSRATRSPRWGGRRRWRRLLRPLDDARDRTTWSRRSAGSATRRPPWSARPAGAARPGGGGYARPSAPGTTGCGPVRDGGRP